MLTVRALRRVMVARHRLEAAQARVMTADWRQQRRQRTRRLIELGGLVAKSRLPEHLAPFEPDVHATLLGALLELVDALEHTPAARTCAARWSERGRQALRGT